MAFIDNVLEPPTYGWQDQSGNLIKPSSKEIILEFFKRINIFKSRKNWLGFISWLWVVCLIPFLIIFLIKYFSWWLMAVGFIYSMVIMGSHGTVWYHRYSTHQAFTFKNSFWRFLTQHLVIKVVPEEAYVISHHVHHAKPDKPGDPYNATAGFLYCFLADVNHQGIAKNLSKEDYLRVTELLKPTGIRCNSYIEYQKWGTVAHPFYTILEWFGNWSLWYLIFFLLGGHSLAFAIFGWASIWALGVRTFNYEGHGKGQDKRKEGVDFNKADLSINQIWPGYVAGEWHNNHHLYPTSARSGFLPYQLDLAWCYIYGLYLIGGIQSYRDSKDQFLKSFFKVN